MNDHQNYRGRPVLRCLGPLQRHCLHHSSKQVLQNICKSPQNSADLCFFLQKKAYVLVCQERGVTLLGIAQGRMPAVSKLSEAPSQNR